MSIFSPVRDEKALLSAEMRMSEDGGEQLPSIYEYSDNSFVISIHKEKAPEIQHFQDFSI